MLEECVDAINGAIHARNAHGGRRLLFLTPDEAIGLNCQPGWVAAATVPGWDDGAHARRRGPNFLASSVRSR